jgi:outer membrane protein assembly factor BamB
MKSIARVSRVSVILGLIVVAAKPGDAEDWPQWRGPNRDNISSETGLLKKWPEGGPPLEWQVEGLGEGIATVSVSNGRICTVGYQGDSEYAIALSQETGQLLWATRIGSKVLENPLMRWLAQRTPTVEKERAYFFRADGDLICLNAADGAELWRKSYPKDFGAPQFRWGYSDYPLIYGDALICSPSGPEAGVVALNKMTGEMIWKCTLPELANGDHSPIVLVELGGAPQVVQATQRNVFGIAAADGKLLWSQSTYQGLYSVLTPNVQGDEVLVAPYGGLALFKITRDASGFEVGEVYSRRGIPFTAFQDKSITIGKHIYAVLSEGKLACLSRQTGETLWPAELRESELANRGTGRSQRFSSPAAVIFADGHLITRDSAGLMRLVEASPERAVEKGAFNIPAHQAAQGATSPVISNGRLYLRDDNRLFCYDLRADRTGASSSPRRIALPDLGLPVVAERRERGPLRSVFVPTPQVVVQKMLELAKVQKSDVVYDLGSGDGRIVIAAAKTYGCRAVGYEIDEVLVKVSRENARQAGVEPLVTIEQKDLYTADLRQATVIALYLLPQQLEALVPQLIKLPPGTRILSHQFAIPGIDGGGVTTLASEGDGDEHKVYLWTTPLHAQDKQ